MTEQYEQYAVQLKNQKLFEMEELYQKYLDDYIPCFQRHFQETCENIIKLQQSGTLGEISYLEYTLLFTNLLLKKEIAEVRIYDENWYFDGCQRIVGTFDFSYLFTKYNELQSELTSYRKRFAGAVTAQETKAFLFSCARSFYNYVVAVCRFAILPCIESEPFLSVRRAEEFEINIGEYMSHTEAIYKENHSRTSKEALDWFSLRREFEYAFEDFSGHDFSGADLSEIDLRYSDLRYAKLVGTDFQDAMLFGTRFCHANMEGADMRYCMLHETDFTGANLTNASFIAAEAYVGVPGWNEWEITGYRRVSFRNATLTGADFRRTSIRDADFTGAVMDDALFQKKQLEYFDLSPEQKKKIQIVES